MLLLLRWSLLLEVPIRMNQIPGALQLVRAIAAKTSAAADLRNFIESRLSRLLGQAVTARSKLTSSLEKLNEYPVMPR